MIKYFKGFILPHLNIIFYIIRRSILYKILKINNKTIGDFSFNFFVSLLYNLRINPKEKFIYNNDKMIYYSRKIRIASHYFSGIDYRMNHILNSYLINQIDFKKGDIVFDCGANIGEFSVALNEKYSGLIYFCFEPSLLEFEALEKNTRNYNSTNFNVALFNKKGVSEFFEENDSGDSSLFGENLNSIQINTDTIDNVLELNKINKIKFLKLEAEGAEPEILFGATKSLKKIEFISVDVGPERGIENKKTATEVNEILTNNGFKLIDLNNKRFVLLYQNKLNL